MNPEDTDKFRRFEDLIQSLVQAPKKRIDELRERPAPGVEAPDKPTDDGPDDARGQ